VALKKRNLRASLAKPLVRPDVFAYHDYKSYLRDWIAYRKATEHGFSIRELATRGKFAVGYLSSVISGTRHISLKTFQKLLPVLGLEDTEGAFLENMVKFATAETQEIRLIALERMNSFGSYQRKNPNEARMVRYMSHWINVAIREMSTMPDFKADPAWIQSQLRMNVSQLEVGQALDFLTSNGFIRIREDGTIEQSESHLECAGEVFRDSLVQYHRQMFMLATQSVDNARGTERNLVGHTISIDPEQYDVARKILDDALTKIQTLPGLAPAAKPMVYHVELALFPITKRSDA
jgi:uncharacterized protein (TIGR02147 family)